MDATGRKSCRLQSLDWDALPAPVVAPYPHFAGNPPPPAPRLTRRNPAALIRGPAAAAPGRTSRNRSTGQVAQLVEQGIENPRVGGSIPSLATIKPCKYLYFLTLGIVADGMETAGFADICSQELHRHQ
jgi:hypothetical protein